jgi:hypothetical protein
MGRPRFYKSNKMIPTKEYKANWEGIFGKKEKKNEKTKSKVRKTRQETSKV